MKTIDGSEAWSPSLEELNAIERRARVERAKASREAFRFLASKVSNLFVRERAAHKVRMIDTPAAG
ncbi:MAG: hypothetical protein KDJ36_00565 [Hyphomicrobiaceae bacterium]|nr:hypothetical protein [Hyphomicrobiaceae bacterium]